VKLLLSLVIALLGLTVLFALSWNDVLPGSWRLQGWVLGIEGRDNRTRLSHAAERLDEFRAARDDVDPGSILFLGSSTMERFPLAKVFPNKPCLNRGINGDAVRDLHARLEDSLPASDPAGIVVAIGGNDLRRLQLNGEAAAYEAIRLLGELRQRYPETPIACLGLFGESEAPDAELAHAERFNELVREAAQTAGCAFVPTQRAELVGDKGRLKLSHAADRYHLNLEGYLLLGRWIVEDGGGLGRLLQP
jgi:lysophospholipase L1-like esterase